MAIHRYEKCQTASGGLHTVQRYHLNSGGPAAECVLEPEWPVTPGGYYLVAIADSIGLS